jgi:hypothetical protein
MTMLTELRPAPLVEPRAAAEVVMLAYAYAAALKAADAAGDRLWKALPLDRMHAFGVVDVDTYEAAEAIDEAADRWLAELGGGRA